jgi:hypothetical protein
MVPVARPQALVARQGNKSQTCSPCLSIAAHSSMAAPPRTVVLPASRARLAAGRRVG